MKITIKRITPWSIALDDARWTQGKKELNKEPSDKFKENLIISQHSPLRDVLYQLRMYDIPYFVAVHLRTHDKFNNHCDNNYIGSQRPSVTGIPRNEKPQDALVNHKITLSAQSFIDISKERLCDHVDPHTRHVWQAALKVLEDVEPILERWCMCKCLWFQRCPEFKSCGMYPQFERKFS